MNGMWPGSTPSSPSGAHRPLRDARRGARETGRWRARPLTRGKSSGCSIDSRDRSTSRVGQRRCCGLGRSTEAISRMVASWNQGKSLKRTKCSRPSTSNQNPSGATLLTSAVEMFFPRSADFIFMFRDQSKCSGDLSRAQSTTLRQGDARFQPEFRLAASVLHVHMRPRLLPGEKEESVSADSEDRGAHGALAPSVWSRRGRTLGAIRMPEFSDRRRESCLAGPASRGGRMRYPGDLARPGSCCRVVRRRSHPRPKRKVGRQPPNIIPASICKDTSESAPYTHQYSSSALSSTAAIHRAL
jgi:hypothetical protein